MELPKNITQIGEVGRDCKIYVEDYAISYMKQLNRAAQDKDMAVALYGRRQEENGITYHFLYGASKLDYLQREVRHLSQAQLQEIERLRRKYFPELEFMGYRILNGEMIEGIHLCEQGICRYIGGYAQFYEKNDAMLAYMLDVRDNSEPEQVDRTKYEEVRKRQDERRSAAGYGEREHSVSGETQEDKEPLAWLTRSTSGSGNLQKMRLAAVGAFALLCLLGIGTFREDELARDEAGDGTEMVAASGVVEQEAEEKDTLLMEDRLEQALLEENQSVEPVASVESEGILENRSATEESSAVTEQTEASQQEIEETAEQTAEQSSEQSSQPSESESKDAETTPVSQNSTGAVAYIVQPGDTLISISLRQYGSDIRVTDICALNNITDPDDIKEGQVIMLPQ